MSKELTAPERSRLRKLEKSIEDGVKSVGESLVEIHDKKLYRENYGTFEKYCQERWSFGRSWSHTLITAEKVKLNLSTIVDKNDIPKSPKQLATLASVPEENRAEVVEEVNERAAIEDRKPTVEDYQKASKPFQAAKESKAKKPKQGKPKETATKLVDQARSHVSPVVKLIDRIAEANGGKGSQYKKADKSIEELLVALGNMSGGKK